MLCNHTRVCAGCVQEKPHNPAGGTNLKASGFYGVLCWSCYRAKKAMPTEREKHNTASKAWYAIPKNQEQHKGAMLAWEAANYEHRRTYNNSYAKARKASDSLFKLSQNLRSLVSICFRNRSWSKTSKTRILLGCTYEFFQGYLAAKFLPGMTWENYGTWHIDHIIPCASAVTSAELEALFHYTNLQPLWAVDNIKKGAKLPAMLEVQSAC